MPGTMYDLNPGSGWINAELFRDWFERHFLEYAPAGHPLLLLMDGHSTDYQPEVVCLAASNGVILFTLPPRTTHVAQPLDFYDVFSFPEGILGSEVPPVHG